jgi:hypothetical protein
MRLSVTEVYELLLCKQAAAKALLNRLELSSTALYLAKEQRRLSIQAQEQENVKMALLRSHNGKF